MDMTILTDFLGRSVMRSVVGEPLGDVQGFFLDIDFSSDDRSIRLTGSAIELWDRTEAFVITAADCDLSPRWVAQNGKIAWPSDDLLSRWMTSGHSAMWAESRSARFFVDAEDRDRGLKIPSVLDSVAAIEFRGASDDGTHRIVFYATPEYPCAIELVTDLERCDEILSNLDELPWSSDG